VDTSLELFAAVAEAFDKDKACEHHAHKVPWQRMYHGGKAEWYVQMQCPNCNRVGNVWAVCDKWKKSAETGPVTCGVRSAKELGIFVVKEKIK
jgi:hypothetical protein